VNVVETTLPGVLILEPKVFGDERGFFYESFNARAFETATGLKRNFVQDNHSRSQKGVLRGLHYQLEHTQGKLVRVTYGEVLDVAVDIRRSSGRHPSQLTQLWPVGGCPPVGTEPSPTVGAGRLRPWFRGVE